MAAVTGRMLDAPEAGNGVSSVSSENTAVDFTCQEWQDLRGTSARM